MRLRMTFDDDPEWIRINELCDAADQRLRDLNKTVLPFSHRAYGAMNVAKDIAYLKSKELDTQRDRLRRTLKQRHRAEQLSKPDPVLV